MPTGACGFNCDVCRPNLVGVCSNYGSGTGLEAAAKIEVQINLFGAACPMLDCALEKSAWRRGGRKDSSRAGCGPRRENECHTRNIKCLTAHGRCFMDRALEPGDVHRGAGIDTAVNAYPLFYGGKMNRRLTLSDMESFSRTKTSSELIDIMSGAEINGQVFATHTIRIATGMLPSMGSMIQDIFSPLSKYTVLMDENTREAAGESLLAQLPGNPERVTVKPMAGWDHATPHIETAALLEKEVSCDALIAVGSGTINDLAKYAAHRLDIPYLAVATAPSMNGYTSSVAALIQDGLKVTLPCRPPVAVLADVDVLARAPADMRKSGYADLLSKPMSNSDWMLASLVVDEPFSHLPGSMVNSAIEGCISEAEGLKKGEVRAVKTLMESLILSGYSMALAGSSAPASGGEHLISHYLDMVAYRNGLHPAMHGFQVALGTLLTAKLYDLVARKTIEELAPPSRFAPDPAVHGKLWPAVRSEAEKQRMDPGRMKERVLKITGNWDGIWDAVKPFRKTSDEILDQLRRAGTPVSPGEHGISPGAIRKAYLYSADIRNRYTILHLARDVGLLHDSADEVLAIFE